MVNRTRFLMSLAVVGALAVTVVLFLGWDDKQRDIAIPRPLLLTRVKPGDPSFLAQAEGLLIDRAGCLAIEEHGVTRNIVWPRGTTLSNGDGQQKVALPDGSVLSVGNWVKLGGGEASVRRDFDANRPQVQGAVRCLTGPTVFHAWSGELALPDQVQA